jgi:hypothetical protein
MGQESCVRLGDLAAKTKPRRVALAKVRMVFCAAGCAAIAAGATVLCRTQTSADRHVYWCCQWLGEGVIGPAFIRCPVPPERTPEPRYPEDEDDPHALEEFQERYAYWSQARAKADVAYRLNLRDYEMRLLLITDTLWRISVAFVPALASSALVCLLLLRRMKRRWSIDGYTRCGNCGYILKGLKEPRCPECSTPI